MQNKYIKAAPDSRDVLLNKSLKRMNGNQLTDMKIQENGDIPML